MPDEAQKLIEDVMAQHLPRTTRVQSTVRPDVYYNEPACRGCDWVGKGFLHEAHRQHLAAEIDAALGGLVRQEQWVPVDANGHRWAPRQKPTAIAALELYRAGGPLDFDDTVPLTHIEYEADA